METDDEIIHSDRIRRKGDGRKPKEHHEPNLRQLVDAMLYQHAYGNPASIKEVLYSSISLAKIQAHLAIAGIKTCARTVLRVVRDLGYIK